MRLQRLIPAASGAAVFLAFLAAIVFVHALHWRAQALVEKASGQLPQISWPELAWMIKPHPSVFLANMGVPPNPYAAIKNPLDSPQDVGAGKRLFDQHCAICHGNGAMGGRGGPNLHTRNFVQGRSDWALYRTISGGIPHTAMIGWRLGRENVWRIVAYLNDILRTDTAVVAGTASPIDPIKPVTPRDLQQPDNDLTDWLMYSRSYNGQRFSPLEQINRENVARVQVKWVRQLTTKDDRRLETSPVVRGNVMYVTTLPANVYALDVSTGAVLWKYEHVISSKLVLCCEGNRGIAVLGDRIFFGTMDAHLISLDARSGRLIWDVTVADSTKGYAITAAPLIVRDMVITGIAGGDFATRGFLDAYDATTGKRRWRFLTIPRPGEPGGDTWEGESYRTGGGPTWMTGSYDPESNLLYWGIGNPGPDFFGGDRRGDNLYTDCVVALDATTGKLRWYFQFTPHDTHDWDAAQIPVLLDNVRAYPGRKLLAWANRNGFYYLLDRITGKFVAGGAFLRQNWADGLDANGRPRALASSEPTQAGVLIYPHPSGATSWWSPTYDPQLQLFYVGTVDLGSIVTSTPVDHADDGQATQGSVDDVTSLGPMQTAVEALDVQTGRVVWQHPWKPRDPLPYEETGGLLSTAGGIVFGGDYDAFFALDAKSGAELWQLQAGAEIVAAPITFEFQGRQLVVMTAGNSIFELSLPTSTVP